CQHSYGSPFTF
nr:immunoglobulin light chain junction region [Macaca mulatta]